MEFLKTFITIALLTTSCLAASIPTGQKIDIIPCREDSFGIPCVERQPRKLVRIEHESLAVPVVHQAEDVHFALNRSSSGFSRVTGVGVRVQRGIAADLRYSITVNAITSERISSLTESLVSRLNVTELGILDSLLADYNHGLSVPILQLLGINLGGTTNLESQTTASMFIDRYNQLSETVEEILESTEEATVAVVGNLRAFGLSMVPVEGFVFVRTARMFFNDGTSSLVVTSDPNETEAATLSGQILPSQDKNLYTGPVDGIPASLLRLIDEFIPIIVGRDRILG